MASLTLPPSVPSRFRCSMFFLTFLTDHALACRCDTPSLTQGLCLLAPRVREQPPPLDHQQRGLEQRALEGGQAGRGESEARGAASLSASP